MRDSKNKSKFRMYAVFAPDPPFLIEFARRHIFTEYLGGLFSFAPFIAKEGSRDFPAIMDGKYWIFADSGSYSAGNTNAKLFLEKPVDRLFEFYKKFDFSYIVEPDYIANDFHSKSNPQLIHSKVYEHNLKFSAQVGILRALRMKEILGKEAEGRIVRPIHGRTPAERLQYLKMLESYLDRVNYIALGGLDTRKFDKPTFESTLNLLDENHITKIHIFGRASMDALDYAISKLKSFDEVSVDSSTWIQKAVVRQLLLFEIVNGKPTLTQLSLKRPGKNASQEEIKENERMFRLNIKILSECKCAACRHPSLGSHERDRFLRLDFLAEKSRGMHPYYETLFVQKASLHNLCQQKMYIKHKLDHRLPASLKD